MAAGRGGRDGHRSSIGKVDDGGDERGRSLVMMEEDGAGRGGRRRRTEEGGVERVFWRPRSTNGEQGGREEGENHVFKASLSQMRGNLQT